jgi:flagellar biosynthesis/type III secretory pathway protein FliH
MILPPELAHKLRQTLTEYEEEQKMSYISSIEQIAIKEGLQKGMEQGLQQGLQQDLQQGIEQGILQKAQEDILEVLTVRFGEVAQRLSEVVGNLTDATMLKILHRQAITIESLDKFEQVLESLPADMPPQVQASPDLDD